MPAAISAMPGEARIGQRPVPPARSTWRNRSTPSPKREAFSRDCKPVTTTCCRTACVIGAEIDASFPAFQNLAGISIGGISNFTSPTLGPVSYSETVLSSGTVRGRIGYAPGNWLFYATGGFAWSYDQLTLTQLASGTTDMPFLWRLGWAAGAGVEVPVAPHWTARLEYLFTDYGISGVLFAAGQQDQFRFFPAGAARRLELSVRQRSAGGGRQRPPPRRKRTASTSTARPRSSGKPILRFGRPMRAPIVCPAAARAARPGTRRSMPACGCGRAPSCGSIRRSIKASVSRTHTAWPDFRAPRPTSSAPITPTRACSAISSGRRSISAAKPRRWTPTSISSPVRRRPTGWC